MSETMREKVFRIQDDPICGRQLLAVRKILAGELIIDEPALITGPGFSGVANNLSATEAATGQDAFLVCLVCCKNFPPCAGITCPSCHLKLCSESCRGHVQHLHNECIIFPKISRVWNAKKARSRKSFYNLILVIRALYLKIRDFNKWEQIIIMESKVGALEKVGAFSELEDVFTCLSWDQFSSLSCSSHSSINDIGNAEISDEDISEAAKHCLGVMRINAFSMFNETYSREGLFFLSSFMSHSCVINTDRQMDVFSFVEGGVATNRDLFSGSRMVVRASVDIEKDEPITTTYLSLLHNTEERNRIMISNWLFTCHYRRCEDPTEYQLLSAGVLCKCSAVNPSYTSSKSTRLENKLFKSDCKCRFDGEFLIALNHVIKSRPRDLSRICELEDWLNLYDNASFFHPNHSLFAHIKLFLSQYFGRQTGGVQALSIDRLKRKILYCFQILKIYDKIMPGIQMCRGVLLFELWCALERLLELKMLPHEVKYPFNEPKNLLVVYEEKDVEIVKNEALRILKYAVPKSPEEAMANILCD